MLFGKIDYLNLLPFHVFLKKYPLPSYVKKGIEFKKDVPSVLCKKLYNRRVDAEKIKVLKKYYADNIPAVEGVDQKEIDRLNSLAEKYFKAGVQGVPYIVNKKELVK